MQSVPTLDRVVHDIVRDFGGTTSQASTAVQILAEREANIASNLRYYAAGQGLTAAQIDVLFRSAGLTFLDDRLQRVADAAAAVRLAQENVVAAQAQLDSIR